MKLPGKYRTTLKTVDPDRQRLWRKVESGILIDGLYGECNRDAFERAIHDLPKTNPLKDIWPLLDQKINSIPPKRVRRIANNSFIRIAAAVFFLISTFLMIHIWIGRNPQYHTELLKEESVESFLSNICASHPHKCKEVDFVELKSEILSLSNEKSEVENSIFSNPADASITKVNERINRQIISLKSQIIEYLE